jgi:hypothetical protein
MGARKVEMDPIKADRFKFDQEDSDDEYDYDSSCSSTACDASLSLEKSGLVTSKEVSISPDDSDVRRRIGRGGRLMIDRRNMGARKVEMDPIKADRFKFGVRCKLVSGEERASDV